MDGGKKELCGILLHLGVHSQRRESYFGSIPLYLTEARRVVLSKKGRRNKACIFEEERGSVEWGHTYIMSFVCDYACTKESHVKNLNFHLMKHVKCLKTTCVKSTWPFTANHMTHITYLAYAMEYAMTYSGISGGKKMCHACENGDVKITCDHTSYSSKHVWCECDNNCHMNVGTCTTWCKT